MRRDYTTITPAVVRNEAKKALATALEFKDHGKVKAGLLLELFLLMACLRLSLSGAVKRFRPGFSHETARQAVIANRLELDELTKKLLDSLYFQMPRRLRRKKHWVVAIDEHRTPFYGDRNTPGVTGGKKKHGSKYAYAYATAVLVHHRHRYTVGLLPLTGGEKPHEVVAALLKQMKERGLRVRGVVLDSGYDSGDVLLLLKRRKLSYSVPLRKKGAGDNRRNAAWKLDVGVVTRVEWKTEKGNRQVKTLAVVVRRHGEKEKRVYAFGGWCNGESMRWRARASLAKRWYRKRFGIETSYRQMNQCKGKTTMKDVCYRLLLIGIALLIRQVWVCLTRRIARVRRLNPTALVAELSLALMLDWIADALKPNFNQVQEIRLC